MAGVKGRSGRQSARVEKNKFQALEKAWKKINEVVEKAEAEKIALPLALKDLGVTLRGDKDNPLTINQVLVKFLDGNE